LQVVCEKQACIVPCNSSGNAAADEVHGDQYNSFGTFATDLFTQWLFTSSDDTGDCTLSVLDSQIDIDLSEEFPMLKLLYKPSVKQSVVTCLRMANMIMLMTVMTIIALIEK